MAQIVAQFFGIIGPDIVPPTNMQEFIPYILTVFVGVVLVVGVFSIISAILKAVFSFRW